VKVQAAQLITQQERTYNHSLAHYFHQE